ncbi:MAG: DUF1207 domain-containing protein [Elusimicrobia bacterium]|nr:DUF1207 domain-containing protein [Elusimicrobiota bacterium]
MKKVFVLIGLCAAVAHAHGAQALFPTQIADPSNPAFEAKITAISGKKTRAEAGLGEEFPIAQKNFDDGSKLGFAVAGGVKARFNISKVTNDFEVADFSIAFPFDYAFNDWALRVMYWHTSSHLGDDYISSNSVLPGAINKHVTDDGRFFASFAGIKKLLLYGGALYSFNTIPDTSQRLGAQGGFEIIPLQSGKSEFFLAANLRALQRQSWNPSLNVKAGVKIKGERQTALIFAEFFSGKSPYLAFAQTQETKYSLGFGFEL